MGNDIRFIEQHDGTTAVVITIPGKHLGADAAVLADWFDTVFWALDKLRSGAWDVPGDQTVNEIGTAIGHLEHRLSPRLDGLRDALIRQHYRMGGSHGRLALAMDVERSTAQSRAKRLPSEMTTWEQWARAEATRETGAPIQIKADMIQIKADDPSPTMDSESAKTELSEIIHYLDTELDNEHSDRQYIAEQTLFRLQNLRNSI